MDPRTPHRSPITPEWDRVRELYEEPNPAPDEIVRRIVEALDETTRCQLCDAAVVRCLDAVLRSSAATADDPENLPLPDLGSGLAAIEIAGAVRYLANDNIAAARVASHFGTLALDAVARTVIHALEPEATGNELTREAAYSRYAAYAQEYRLNELARSFVAHHLEQAFCYFVARDISDFVGSSALPNVAEAQRVVDRVGQFCRQRGALPGLHWYEQDLQQIVRSPLDERMKRLRPLVQTAAQSGLAALAGQDINLRADWYHHSADDSEHVLVARCQGGDKRACDALLERYKPRMYALVRGIGQDQDWVEDVVVEILVQLYLSVWSFRGESSFKTWVYRVAKNVCMMELRRVSRRERQPNNISNGTTNSGDPGELVLDKLMRDDALQAVAELPEKYRMAVGLYYVGQCSYPQIAEVLNVPLGTAKTHVYQGLKRLRRMLAGDNERRL